MLECLNNNILVMFGGRILQQTIGCSMGILCAPPFVDLFIYSYKTDFIGVSQEKRQETSPIL